MDPSSNGMCIAIITHHVRSKRKKPSKEGNLVYPINLSNRLQTDAHKSKSNLIYALINLYENIRNLRVSRFTNRYIKSILPIIDA